MRLLKLRGVAGPPAPPAASFAQRLATLKLHLAGSSDSAARRPAELGDLVARIDAVRRSRNLIAHRLSGVCADSAKGEPHIVCDSGAGVRRTSVRITQGELTDLLAEIDRCARDIARVGAGGKLT